MEERVAFIIGCSKNKKSLIQAEAKELYAKSGIFNLHKDIAENLNPNENNENIFILSGLYGLIPFDKVIENYNVVTDNVKIKLPVEYDVFYSFLLSYRRKVEFVKTKPNQKIIHVYDWIQQNLTKKSRGCMRALSYMFYIRDNLKNGKIKSCHDLIDLKTYNDYKPKNEQLLKRMNELGYVRVWYNNFNCVWVKKEYEKTVRALMERVYGKWDTVEKTFGYLDLYLKNTHWLHPLSLNKITSQFNRIKTKRLLEIKNEN